MTGSPLLPAARIAGAPISWGICEADPWGIQMPAERVLTEMQSVQITATELGPDGFLGATPAEVAANLAQYGMRMVGGFVPVPFHCATDEDLAEARHAITILKECGADVVVFAARSTDGSYDNKVSLSEEEWAQFKVTLAELGAEVLALGLVPTLHPHVGTAIESAEMVQRLIDETDIALTVDTGHLIIGGTDPVQLIKDHPQRVAHMHLKDVVLGLADQVRSGELAYLQAVKQGMYVPLGSGGVQIAEAVRQLESTGYTGWYVMEQDCALAVVPAPGEPGPVDDVRASIAFLTG